MPADVVIITGASSGLGFALARALAEQGNTIAMLARNPEKLEAAAQAIRDDTGSSAVAAFPADVSSERSVRDAIAVIAATFGGVDMLINCAGIMREGYFESLTEADFREVLAINVMGAVNCCRAALPYLQQSGGRIVNIASMASHTGVFGYTAYCASKHALKGFSEALYHELAPRGIAVQLVCPPEFESPMADALAAGRTPENAAHTLMIPREPIDVIVRDTLRAIERGQYHSITGWRARLMGFAIQHFPRLSRHIARQKILEARAAVSSNK